jgi:hypothetical protein
MRIPRGYELQVGCRLAVPGWVTVGGTESLEAALETWDARHEKAAEAERRIAEATRRTAEAAAALDVDEEDVAEESPTDPEDAAD